MLELRKDVQMSSLEVCEMINKFRKEEDNSDTKLHKILMRDIRNEVKALENMGIRGGHNFVLSSYKTSQNKIVPCYILTKPAILQMLNKESPYVRYKTQEYIEALENELTQKTSEQYVEDLSNTVFGIAQTANEQIKTLRQNITIKVEDRVRLQHKIKRFLGIKKKAENLHDYELIVEVFFAQLGVEKWEDITYNSDLDFILDKVLESYSRVENMNLQINFANHLGGDNNE